MTAAPIRRRIVLAALLAGLACVDPAPAAPPEKGEAKGAVVPFEMLATNHMLVSATINGKGPYELIFDVGAPITLLSNKAGIDSGAVKADAPRSMLFSLRGEADVKTLKVGDLTAKDVPVIVLDHPLLKAMGQMLGRRLDGIMGYTFFARYRTTIDYQARKMTFEPVETKVRNLMRDLPDRLAGPRVARHRMLTPGGLWGLDVGEPAGGLETPGVPVRTVLADSPAARAGLKAGDVLTTLDGRWTTTVSDTYAAAAAVPAKRAVPVVVLRDGKELTLTVTPAEGF
jgi:hypothetical protein